ncbi:helix-turn-helix transcriptional regulator [Dyella choica]|uniref:AraC family transcriptional regulator n=1 Tax=Dyella choica TaxID=1927959 RepID=A0A432M2K6_9GAMM|nr:AraC family transcriptional regulator [Dyella choica]RUL72686.1 AraC family transcriptional regulator [Dyella choica]
MEPLEVVERKYPLPGLAVIRRLLETCALEAISLQEGGLTGAFGSYRHADAGFCSFVSDFALHGRFVVPHGHFLACYLHDPAPESWCAGMSLAQDTMLLALPDSTCTLMLGRGSRVSMVLAPLQGAVKRSIDAHAEAFGLSGRQFALFRPECHAGMPLRTLYGMLYQGLAEGNSHQLLRLLENGAMDFLADERAVRALSGGSGSFLPYCANYRASYPAFRKAVQFMRDHLQRDIYMEEVAAAAQISDRSLRMSFDDLLGVSPTRYLTLLRLHEASRQLSMRRTKRLSVKSVAMNCGIWNLSRFAANYRRAFDEHPSDTLMRACSFAS